MLITDIKVPIYDLTINFILFEKYEDLYEALNKKGFKLKEDKDFFGLTGFAQVSKRTKFYIAVLNDKDRDSTLVHELFHLTQDILETVGVEFEARGQNESFAYLIEYLYKETINKLKDVSIN